MRLFAKHSTTLLDRTTFHVDEETWERFVEALDAPPTANPRLRDLMAREAAWDE